MRSERYEKQNKKIAHLRQQIRSSDFRHIDKITCKNNTICGAGSQENKGLSSPFSILIRILKIGTVNRWQHGKRAMSLRM